MAARLTAYLVVAIVTATVIAGLIVGAQRDEADGPVDLIVVNGRVFTADGRGTVAEALAVRGNQVLAVGSNREIKRLRRRATRVIDAHGGTVLPGFNDAHVHLLGGGLALEKVDLLDATTLPEIERKIREFAAANPDRPWVLGRGWYYQPFPGGLPTRQLLDALVPDRPAHMVAYDGHTAWVNSKALALAGITRRTPNPPNGVIVKDPRTGEPTGVLKEAAQRLIEKVLPEPTRADRLRALRAAVGAAHRAGVTSVQNASGSAQEFELYDELRRAGELKLRVYSAISAGGPVDEMRAAELDAIRARYADDVLFKTGAVKLMIDGVIEAHTAAMLAPYANRPATAGTPMMTPEELDRTVALLDARGWQIMIHAIGDRGIRLALDAYERAARVNAPPARGRRHRIEHIETIDPADIPRFGRLGVIASMQPFHGSPSDNQIAVWTANIGPERASRGWAYRSIAEAGGRLAFGSDWPVVTLDPRFGLHMAVTRTTPAGTPAGGWFAAEALPLARALEAYTSGAAFASFDEHRKGTLAPGMLADIVILSADLFSLPPARLLDAVVTMTIFDGKVVYERQGETD
jgi:predicted amidohydrolase YtcJ